MGTRALDALTLGHLGEKFVYDLFENAGRNPVFGGPGDIRLDGGRGLAIEVKSSLPGRSGRRRYQFCIVRQDKDGTFRTNAAKSDLVVLLAYTDLTNRPAVFCIPSSRLTCRTLKLPANLSGYYGRWSHYRNFDRAILETQGART